MRQSFFALGLLQILKQALAMLTPAAPAQPILDGWPDDVCDYLPEYKQEEAGQLLISRYPDGSVRLENPESGVIQEERADGTLLVSLPHGKLIRQGSPGESLLVFDLDHPGAPLLGRVSSVRLEQEPRLVYHYQDRTGHHFVELSTLRNFRSRQAAA